jgi:hypothetical protein
MNDKKTSRYHDVLVESAALAGNGLPHWKIARIAFEEALERMLEQEKQDEWQHLLQDDPGYEEWR